MSKQVIRVSRKLKPYTCLVCKELVLVENATPRIIRTDKATIYGWDYNHEHKNTFTVDAGKVIHFIDE